MVRRSFPKTEKNQNRRNLTQSLPIPCSPACHLLLFLRTTGELATTARHKGSMRGAIPRSSNIDVAYPDVKTNRPRSIDLGRFRNQKCVLPLVYWWCLGGGAARELSTRLSPPRRVVTHLYNGARYVKWMAARLVFWLLVACMVVFGYVVGSALGIIWYG